MFNVTKYFQCCKIQTLFQGGEYPKSELSVTQRKMQNVTVRLHNVNNY